MAKSNIEVNGAAGCGIVVGAVLAVAGIIALNGLIIMLLAGAIGAALGWGTLGYGTSVLIGIALGFIGSFFKGNSSK